ncbi:hypothetical protein MTR_2g450490 [Medicago truncatula]|uniref:Uncharacterized protein n=1 Tax=Medicago truncatula TaxID=3880 RepID=A0A072V8F6_MEDTR|nr:hypothetical protein MTR_2g450490 [Medicago truncatula]
MIETPEEEHTFVENVLDLEIPSLVLLPTNSEELINEQSMDQHHISSFLLEDFINEQSMDHQYLMNQQHSLEETDTTVKAFHGNNRVEERNTLTNADAASPSPHLELVSSSQEQDVDVRGFQKITKTNNDQSSLNHNAFIQLSSNIEEQFPEDDDFRDSKSKPSPTNSIPLPLKGHFTDFGFDKDWLDSVERRALFSDIKVSQDALQKLLDSKQQVSKEVEVLRLKIDILSQHVEDLKHQLTTSETVLKSIIQEEAQVLETKATFIAPLGY